jgi:hypothetical protein
MSQYNDEDKLGEYNEGKMGETVSAITNHVF